MSDKTTVSGKWTSVTRDGSFVHIHWPAGMTITLEQAKELADLLSVALGKRTVVGGAAITVHQERVSGSGKVGVEIE